MTRPEWRLAVALAIGLIVGVERERRKAERPDVAGVRSFALVGLLGGVLAFLGGHVGVWVGAAFVGLLAIASHVSFRGEDTGITTEVALFLTYVLGSLAMEHPLHALGLAVSATMVLALRTRIHNVARRLISDQELFDGLTLAVSALVVLPLLPNRSVDPWGVLNPFVIWRLVVTVTAITAGGYVAQRSLGPRYGLTVAGLASG
ncbi:MAG: MgtC/SapB family protein, partial [Polyangiaceae bacterium]|nr:MgtC/SapB family protein [Polyangiaceae bacterium]